MCLNTHKKRDTNLQLFSRNLAAKQNFGHVTSSTLSAAHLWPLSSSETLNRSLFMYVNYYISGVKYL